MRSLSRKWFAKQAWPDRSTDLLIKSAVLPEDRARACWRKWIAQHDIDDCNWPQFKLLARLSGRLSKIDPECSELPRLNGMAKSLWTQSQMRLVRGTEAIDVLLANDIPVFLIKTAALEALNLTNSTRRVTSDIDLMVRRDHLRKALEVLGEHGWDNPHNEIPPLDMCKYHAGVNLTRGSGENKTDSDVDVHHQPVHMPFLPDAVIDALWSSGETVNFRGRPALAPEPHALMVITAMQGIRRFIPSHLTNGMWALDLMDFMETYTIDWSRIVELARQYRGVWATLCCLSYLNEELDVAVPQSVLDELTELAVFDQSALMFYAQSPTSGYTSLVNKFFRQRALERMYKMFARDSYVLSQSW